MKIAFYSGMIGDVKTGTGVHLTNLLRHIVTLRPQAEYTSFLPSTRNAKLHETAMRQVDAGGQIQTHTVAIPAKVLHLTQTYLRLPPMQLLLGHTYDVYHQMWASTDPVVPSSKLVVTMHDTVCLGWPKAEGRLFRRIGPLLRRAAAVITVSDYSRQTIIEAFGVQSERIHTVYNGCDPEIYHPDYSQEVVAQTLHEAGITPPYLLYIGGQSPRKNLPRLIRAFALAKSSNRPPHKLVLVGPLNSLRSEIKEAIEKSGYATEIKVLGYVEDRIVPHLYQGAAALVFPSLYEGFGLPVVEAMACGTPVLTSKVTSLPEVAGDAALLVNPASEEEIAQGITTLLNENTVQRASRIGRGLLQAQKFSWKRCAQEHLALYDSIIAKGSF